MADTRKFILGTTELSTWLIGILGLGKLAKSAEVSSRAQGDVL